MIESLPAPDVIEPKGARQARMGEEALKAYWKPGFDTLYDTCFQELASEALMGRWQKIDIVTSLLVALTASGSAVAGWALWSAQGAKLVWAMLAGVASLASIAHSVMGVPGRVREQEELRRLFSELRVDCETFQQQLRVGLEMAEARAKYDKLRERLTQCTGRTRPDLALTTRLRKKVQERLNAMLKARGYLE